MPSMWVALASLALSRGSRKLRAMCACALALSTQLEHTTLRTDLDLRGRNAGGHDGESVVRGGVITLTWRGVDIGRAYRDRRDFRRPPWHADRDDTVCTLCSGIDAVSIGPERDGVIDA